jgi:hypothetical protein
MKIMETLTKKPVRTTTVNEDSGDYFHLGATIVMALLFLLFIGTTFYLGVTIYLEN